MRIHRPDEDGSFGERDGTERSLRVHGGEDGSTRRARYWEEQPLDDCWISRLGDQSNPIEPNRDDDLSIVARPDQTHIRLMQPNDASHRGRSHVPTSFRLLSSMPLQPRLSSFRIHLVLPLLSNLESIPLSVEEFGVLEEVEEEEVESEGGDGYGKHDDLEEPVERSGEVAERSRGARGRNEVAGFDAMRDGGDDDGGWGRNDEGELLLVVIRVEEIPKSSSTAAAAIAPSEEVHSSFLIFVSEDPRLSSDESMRDGPSGRCDERRMMIVRSEVERARVVVPETNEDGDESDEGSVSSCSSSEDGLET